MNAKKSKALRRALRVQGVNPAEVRYSDKGLPPVWISNPYPNKVNPSFILNRFIRYLAAFCGRNLYQNFKRATKRTK